MHSEEQVTPLNTVRAVLGKKYMSDISQQNPSHKNLVSPLCPGYRRNNSKKCIKCIK